jgi:hypothetical protein
MTDVDQEMELVAKPLHDLLHFPLGVEVLLRPLAGCSSPTFISAFCRFGSTRRSVPSEPTPKVGNHCLQAPNHRIETRSHRGQMGGVPHDAKEPREVPVMGDLDLSLQPE